MSIKSRFKNLIVSRLKEFSVFLIFCVSFQTYGQSIEVNSANGSIKEKSLKGFVVCLELDLKTVERSWTRYLKSLGKFETVETQAMVGTAIMLASVADDAIDFYSKVTVSPRCVQVFMGATRAGSGLELAENQTENVRKLLHDFAVEQYRQDLISQISEADRVVNLAVKAHDKRTSEANSLKNKISKNLQERKRLIKSLEENASQLIRLKNDSTRNSADLEAAFDEIKKVRQITEEKKNKLSTVK